MEIKSFFHPDTFTLSYLVYDANSRKALLIDSVADYDPKSSSVSFKSCEIIDDYMNCLLYTSDAADD